MRRSDLLDANPRAYGLEDTDVQNDVDTGRSGRRVFLAGLVGSLLFGLDATTAVAVDRQDVPVDESREVEELSGPQKYEVVGTAMSDDEVTSIMTELSKQGLRIDVPSAKARSVHLEDVHWKWVKFPFVDSTSTERERKGAIVWSDHDDLDPFGYVSTKSTESHAEPSDDIVEAINRSLGGSVEVDDLETTPVVTELTKYHVEGGRVVSETNRRTIPVVEDRSAGSLRSPSATDTPVSTAGTGMHASAATASSSGDCLCTAIAGNPLLACAPCGTWDVDCMTDIALNYAEDIVACGACRLSPSFKTCGACLATVLESIDDDSGLCCWCDDVDLF